MTLNLEISLFGIIISIIACLSGFIVIEYMLQKEIAQVNILLFSIIPCIFFLFGMLLMLFGMSLSSDSGIPISMYVLCLSFWFFVFATLDIAYILNYPYRLKVFPIHKVINYFIKK
jgi:hypothetical protein